MQEQNPSPFSSRPPLPTPDGNVFAPEPAPPPQRGDWKSAPAVVRGWAYPLTWLVIVLLSLGILVSFFTFGRDAATGIGMLVLFSLLMALVIWLNRGLKSGAFSAWIIQLIYSGLVVLTSPIGLLTGEGNVIGGIIGLAIHGYILSQWFKPETKAWFGK